MKKKSTSGRTDSLATIGWREWVVLPEFGIKRIKAKIDSGARSSSLHAYDIEEYSEDGDDYVRFKVHYLHRDDSKFVEISTSVMEHREVKSSSGHTTVRPVIITDIEVLGESWPIEITLADRQEMGFRMLLGREAIRGKFLIDTNRSYYGGRPKKKLKRKPPS